MRLCVSVLHERSNYSASKFSRFNFSVSKQTNKKDFFFRSFLFFEFFFYLVNFSIDMFVYTVYVRHIMNGVPAPPRRPICTREKKRKHKIFALFMTIVFTVNSIDFILSWHFHFRW